MKKTNIQPGDIVQLKTGSIKMTVGSTETKYYAGCNCYYYENGEFRNLRIDTAALMKVPRKKPAVS